MSCFRSYTMLAGELLHLPDKPAGIAHQAV
jgi:hypothetical protein